MIGFLGHAIVYSMVCFFLLFVAGFFVAFVVGLSWGIGLASHGFFFVVAPELRRRWIDREVGVRVHQTVRQERKALTGRHAKTLESTAAALAHEIRNPITAARSLVQQIGEDPTSDQNEEYAKVAVGELERVERAISHLLRFARDEEVRLERSDLSQIVEAALGTLRSRLDRSVVELDTRLEPVEIDADPEKLSRVVINLVNNAIESLEESEFPAPKVTISCGENLARTEAWLSVRDNGPGIEKDQLEKIFSPFHTSKANGTGLGLAICQKIAEAHGGRIEVSSELGEGAELIVELPKRQGEQLIE